MEKYRREYPHADILLFEPDREDADMFFANIFSYAQRKRLCEAAYSMTRQHLLAQRGTLGPLLGGHGIRLAIERLRDAGRSIHAAVNDPRPLWFESPAVRTAARDLTYALDLLERWVRDARGPQRPSPVMAR